MMVSHACKTCPTMLTYDRKTAWRLHCEPCQIKRDRASKYRSLKQRRERFGRYYTPMLPTEKRI
jgi:hypothetical protein